MVARLGPDLARSWFGEGVSLGSFRNDTLQVLVESSFKLSRIQRDYIEALTSAAKWEFPSLERVHLVDARSFRLREAAE